MTRTYTELPGPVTADMLIDLIGHQARVFRSASTKEELYFGTDTVGGEGLIELVRIEHYRTPAGLRYRQLLVMFEDGHAYEVGPSTRILLVKNEDAGTPS